MPRQAAVSISNNLNGGLVTEATALNFSENACTETYDCVFDTTGEVYRRNGFDFEANHSTKTINRTGGVVRRFMWQNVSGDGDVSLLVVQVGNTLHFYDTANTNTLSDGEISDTVDLTDFSPVGAPDPAPIPCQFSSGLGYLFVSHPHLNSFSVSFDPATENITTSVITLQIRDFDGIDDGLAVTARPTSLTDSHKYNLLNQGWTTGGQVYTSTSSGAVYIRPNTGSATTSFTIASGQTISAGETLFAYGTNKLYLSLGGTVSSYSGTTLVINNMVSTGAPVAGTADPYTTPWIIAREPPYLQVWNNVLGTYPSNADVWWFFKDSTDTFNPGLSGHSPVRARPAPKGRFILNVYNQDRTTASGISGLTTVTTSYQRASTTAFFAGRLFYSGVNYVGFNSKIYFSQIIQNEDQFGLCYQANDPTSEELSDFLPDDGGVLSIPEAGTIVKLFALKEGLLVFAANGVWFVTGSTGLGFTATDYTIQKISSVPTLTADSFVDVDGFPFWWNTDGIYTCGAGQNGGIGVQAISENKIKTFFNNIDVTSKRNARGVYNSLTGIIQWLYRSTESGTVEETQEYDRILNLNTRTGAFYPWTISNSDVKIHDVAVVQSTGGAVSVDQVVDDNGDIVIDDGGDNVIVYALSPGASVPIFKYIVSYADASTYEFTFAEERDTDFVDWATYDTGVNYTSYFISGYKIRGDAQRKFQSNYVYVYSNNEQDTQFYIQGHWNFANTGNSGKWTSRQLVTNSNNQYNVLYKRLKIRGEGVALQLMIESVPGEPFGLYGWSAFETVNASI